MGRLLLIGALLSLVACAHAQTESEPDQDQHAEPDVVGITHKVAPGQTLYRIAKTYGVDERDLAELNDIERPQDLRTGQLLFIPGARAPLDVAPGPPSEPEQTEETAKLEKAAHFAWPLHGLVVSRFGIRGGEHHDGIDIAAPLGTNIAAAGPGKVIFAGEQRGYGKLAVIDHGSGEATVYAHCKDILVKVGDEVKAGQTIATVGRTGRATGPRLHFEVRMHAVARNPLFYLPDH